MMLLCEKSWEFAGGEESRSELTMAIFTFTLFKF
jgi:hypothetical protein